MFQPRFMGIFVGTIFIVWFFGCTDNSRPESAEVLPKDQSVPARAAPGPYYKLNKIVKLRQDLAAKKTEVVSLKEEYLSGAINLKKEINRISEQAGLVSYDQAIANQKIKNDLQLIRIKLAYADKLRELEARLEAGYNEADFMVQRVQDDLKLARVLDKKEIQILAEQIGNIAEKYLPDINKLAIDEKTLRLKPPEDIWDWVKTQEARTEAEPREKRAVSRRESKNIEPEKPAYVAPPPEPEPKRVEAEKPPVSRPKPINQPPTPCYNSTGIFISPGMQRTFTRVRMDLPAPGLLIRDAYGVFHDQDTHWNRDLPQSQSYFIGNNSMGVIEIYIEAISSDLQIGAEVPCTQPMNNFAPVWIEPAPMQPIWIPPPVPRAPAPNFRLPLMRRR